MSRILGSFGCKRFIKLGFAFLIVMFLSPTLRAQQDKGSVSGTVTDQQSALISKVKVIVTNQATGLVYSTDTTDSGTYRVPLEASRYSVEFTKNGFETHKVGSIDVRAGKDTTVDMELRVGVVSSQVFVTAPGMDLDKSSPTVRINIPGKIIEEIPMPSSSSVPAGARNMSRFALFAPGIARVLFQNDTSANGHRGRENNFMIDGTDNNDQSVTLPALLVPPEAIQEMDVQASTFSAEYGRNLGGQINVITRSGTNSYNGQLWEFYRGNALEPFALADQRAGLTSKPRLVDHQFGGTFGGPIIKNKTFVFGMVQGNLLRTGPRASSTATIPTPTGYAALLTAPPRSGQSEASRAAVLEYLSFLPEVHSGVNSYTAFSTPLVNGTPVEMGTFSSVIPTKQNIWYGSVKVDHQFAPTDKLTFRSHVDRRNSPLNTGNLAFGERWAVDSKYFGQNHFIGYTKTLNTNFVNESRVGYTRLDPSFVERDPVTPTIILTNLFQIGVPRTYPQERREQTWQFQNVSTYLFSKHILKFGADLARTNLFQNNAQDVRGTWTFASMQDFMNNQTTSLVFLASTPTRYTFNQWRQAYFVQDDYKLRRNLTVNLGLRYELSAVPLGGFGATTDEVLNAFVPGPVERDTNNWAPRVGFAYSPQAKSGLLGTLFGDGKSAIRGGFGVSYDQMFYSLLASPATNYPRTDTQTLSGTTAPALDQFPVLPPKVTTPTLTAGTTFVNIPSDTQLPTSNYWSLSIQRQIRSNYTVELGYSGNRSHHLFRQSQNNPGVLTQAMADAVIATCTPLNLGTCQGTPPPRLIPNWGSRQSLEATGNAAYDGMYVQVNALTSFGLRLGANYTWSANFSDSEEFSNDGANGGDGGLSGSSAAIPQDFMNRRNEWARSVFDRPHRMSFNYTYEIPWFHTALPMLNNVLGGWQVSGFTELQSGMPFTIRTGVDTVGNLIGLGSITSSSGRPDYNPGGILLQDPATGNLRTFTIPLDGTGIVTAPHVTNPSGAITILRNSMPGGGTLGRNTFRGPGYASFNMSLMKRINLPGDRQLQLRGDFINVFNHDNFPNPDGNMSSVTFGKQIWRPLTDTRQVLLGVKLAF